MTFKEYIGNAYNWIKKAIKAIWHIFKVIVKHTIKFIGTFMRAIGDFIGGLRSDIESGLKKIFVVRTRKGDLAEIIRKANNEGKIKEVNTTTEELFGGESVKTDYDYSFVITDNDFNPVKIETVSAEELDKKIGQKFNDDVSEIKY
jgi:hypothetical protein